MLTSATVMYKSSAILFLVIAGVANGQYFQLTIQDTTTGKYSSTCDYVLELDAFAF